MANDVFANIAASGIGGRKELLYDPEPPKIKRKKCALKRGEFAPKSAPKKISTKEELYSELSKMKEQYAPFLKNFAPEIKPFKERLEITEFLLDGKEKITIPHYMGPLGYAKKVY